MTRMGASMVFSCAHPRHLRHTRLIFSKRYRDLTQVTPRARSIAAEWDKEGSGGIRVAPFRLQEQQILKLDIGTNGVVHTEVVGGEVDAEAGSEVIVGQLGNQRVRVLDCKHILTAQIAGAWRRMPAMN